MDMLDVVAMMFTAGTVRTEETMYAVSVQGGTVVAFDITSVADGGVSVVTENLTPDQAREIAALLVEAADKVDNQ